MFVVILFFSFPSFPLPSPPWSGCVRVVAEGRKGGQTLNGCTSRFWRRRMSFRSWCVCCVRFDWVGVMDGEITSGLNCMDRGDSAPPPPLLPSFNCRCVVLIDTSFLFSLLPNVAPTSICDTRPIFRTREA